MVPAQPVPQYRLGRVGVELLVREHGKDARQPDGGTVVEPALTFLLVELDDAATDATGSGSRSWALAHRQR
jgi:hypothetical protein